MTKREAMKVALREAEAVLVIAADGIDLDDDLSEADEDKVRAALRELGEILGAKGKR